MHLILAIIYQYLWPLLVITSSLGFFFLGKWVGLVKEKDVNYHIGWNEGNAQAHHHYKDELSQANQSIANLQTALDVANQDLLKAFEKPKKGRPKK